MANGLLDFLNTPGGIGLLSGIATYAANARRGTPVNNIGRGLAGGLAGYGQAKDDIAREQENAFNRQFKNYQLEELKQKMEAAKTAQQWQANLPKMMEQAKTKVTPYEADNAFGEDLGNLANVQQGNPQALRDYLIQPGSPYAGKVLEQQLFPETVVVGRTLKKKDTGETLGYDETWKEEQAASRAQSIEELNMRLQDQQLSREQNAALRRELAAQSTALRRDLMVQGNKPPSGYKYTPDGNLEAIKGGPADIKAGELGEKREKTRQMYKAQAKNVLDAVNDAKKLVGVTTAGIGGVTRSLPMTGARDLDAKLTTIKANLGFDRLQQMRDLSPTGGALGQVAVQELTALQATIASLDQLQSPAQLMQSLDKIEKHYANWLKTVDGSAERSPSSSGGAKFLGFE